MRARAQHRLRLPALTLALCALALALPGASLAGEAAGASEATPASSTTVQAPAPAEAPAGATSPPASAGQEGAPGAGADTTPEAEAPAPQVRAEHSQGASAHQHVARARTKKAKGRKHSAGARVRSGAAAPAKGKAPSPSTLTPPLPSSLQFPFGGLPSFYIESFQIPPFLLPIFQAAGTAYEIPWQVLAAINEVETDYGRDLSVSSAGAEGWMQFLPAEWAQYGVDANGDGWEDPYNPADAIFAAARYLRAAGGNRDIRAAVYAYNHSQSYVESVMLRAQLLGGTPPELLGAITGLTEARFPVYAPSHFSDGFPTVAEGTPAAKRLVATTIYSQAGAPVIAAQDGEVVQIGESPSLGRSVELRDAYGNTYVYAHLGELSSVYPVLEPRVHSALSPRIAKPAGSTEPAPTGPATAGAQPRSPLSEGAAISGLALGAAAALEPPPSPPAPAAPAEPSPQAPPQPPAKLHSFTAGANEVYLHPLVPGVQVIAGTVLGHVGSAQGAGAAGEAPHILFQVRPAGAGAPLIDPKPVLDGWVALEDTSIFRARGENPFLATSPTVGQVLLESKQQLQPQILHDAGVHLDRCGREDVQEGRVDKRVLAMLEYLSVSGLRPTVAGLPCAPAVPAQAAANAPADQTSESVEITAINDVALAGHETPGSLADETVRKLLMLQGFSRPQRIVSAMSFPGAEAAIRSESAVDALRVSFGAPGAPSAHAAQLSGSGLTPSEWVKLIDRLGDIPDPTVASGHSSAAIRDPSADAAPTQGEAGGDD